MEKSPPRSDWARDSWYLLALTIPSNLLNLSSLGLPLNLIALTGISFLVLLNKGAKVTDKSNRFLLIWCLLITTLMLSGIETLQNHKIDVLVWIVTVPIAAAGLRLKREGALPDTASFVFSSAVLTAVISILAQVFPTGAGQIFAHPAVWRNEWGFPRFLGSVGDYELLGELMALGIIAGAAQLSSEHIRFKKLIGFSLIAAVLLMTGTRGSLLISLLSIPVLLLSNKQLENRSRNARNLTILISIALVLVSILGESILARMESLNTSGSFSALMNREQVWRIFDSRTSGLSGLLGIGPHYPFESIGVMPHSIWRSFNLLGGLSSVAVFGMLLLAILYRIWKVQSNNNRPLVSSASFWLILGFIIDQSKIEFLRLPSYLAFSCLFLMFIYAENRNGDGTGRVNEKTVAKR